MPMKRTVTSLPRKSTCAVSPSTTRVTVAEGFPLLVPEGEGETGARRSPVTVTVAVVQASRSTRGIARKMRTGYSMTGATDIDTQAPAGKASPRYPCAP